VLRPVTAKKMAFILTGLFGIVIAVFLSRFIIQQPSLSGDKVPLGNPYTVQGEIRGKGENSLLRPLAAVMDDQGQIYVADSSHHRVLVFDLDGKVIAKIGKPGTGQGGFDYPTAVAVKDNRILISDSTNSRIQVLSKQGEFLYSFPRTEDNLGKVKPLALTLDSKDNVYVTDGAGQRVIVFDIKGRYLRSFGKQGTGQGEFGFPNGIALDEEGQNLFVADFANSRIQVFTPDGRFKKVFNGQEAFSNPRGLAFDPVKKHLYVADIFGHRIVVLDEKGQFLGSFGSIGSGLRQFHFPNGLWYGKGTLLVTDRENNRVAIINTGSGKGND